MKNFSKKLKKKFNLIGIQDDLYDLKSRDPETRPIVKDPLHCNWPRDLPVSIEAGGGAADPGHVLNVDQLDAPHLVPREHQQFPLTELPWAHLHTQKEFLNAQKTYSESQIFS